MSNFSNPDKIYQPNDENYLENKRQKCLTAEGGKLPKRNGESAAFGRNIFHESLMQPQNSYQITSESSTASGSTLQSSNSASSMSFTEEKSIIKSSKRQLFTNDCDNNLSCDNSVIPFELPECAPVLREDLDDDSDEDESLPIRMIILDNLAHKKKPPNPYASSEFEVERLLLCQSRNNNIYYLIKWEGYGLDELTWQKKVDLNCDKMLKKYEDRVALCETIFNSISQRDKYFGYFDSYKIGIITPAFVEQNKFEISLTKLLQENHLAPIFVENWTRICGTVPTNFTWIAESLFSYPAKLSIEKSNSEIPATKCVCEVCNPQTCPCLKAKITAKGLIRSDVANFINECHKDCQCCKKCPSKIYRRGRSIPIMLFKTPKCGWSVRTMVRIPRRRFVMEYVGLIKLYEECHSIDDQTYLFNCDLPDGSIKYVIDATEYGNESRFVNHSCDGNMDAFAVLGYHSTSEITRIVFFSNRDIEAGEELTFSYWRTELDLNSIKPGEKRRCHCGAENCRKYLF